jgi:multidrug efflux pump subunit AcrB
MFLRLLETHGRALVCLTLALAVAGLIAVLHLPVGLFPVTSFPRVRIEVDAGAMPAAQMLLQVTQPLEEQTRAVPGALDVQSTTSRGSAEIFIDFPWGSDMTQALLRVDAALAQTLPQLPEGTTYEAIQMSPSVLMPFASYALVSDSISAQTLRRMAQFQIAPRLTGIEGVSRVGVQGGEIPEVQVTVAPQALRAHGLTLEDVTSALSASNALDALGRLEDDDRLYLTLGNNAFSSPASVADVLLRAPGGKLVRLGDIASVQAGMVPQWLLVKDNGKAAVTLDVYQQDSADVVRLARTVDTQLAAFVRTQPASLHVYQWYDQTALVRSSISALTEAILIGLALAAIVVLAALRNLRAALIALAIVPIAVLGTTLLLSMLGATLNIMTLGGIAAAIGLLIDDAIVMIEHIARRAGAAGIDTPSAAVLPAAREFLPPLTGSSLATLIIFVPLAFLSGITGAFFKSLSMTMVAALSVSWLLAALIVPLAARRLIRFDTWHDPLAGSPGRWARWHARMLQQIFSRPWLPALVLLLLLLAALLAYHQTGSGFLPQMDEGGFVLDYQTRPGTSLAETDRELSNVEAILAADPAVDTYSRRTGAGLGGDLKESYQGDFFVHLVAPGRRARLDEIMDRITSRIGAQVPGIQLDPHQVLDDMIGDMVGRPQPIVIELTAADPRRLGAVATRVASAIRGVAGVVPESIDDGVIPAGDALQVQVDPAAAASAGDTVQDIQNQLQQYLTGSVVTRYAGTLQTVGVRVRLQAPDQPLYRSKLGELPLRSPTGRNFPLGAVATVHFVAGQPQITRNNLAQVVDVTAETAAHQDLGAAIAAVRSALAAPGVLPPDIDYRIGGAYEQQQQALAGMIRVFFAAAAAEFALLLFLYQSVRLALIVLVSALLSSGAAFLGLWATGVPLNITAMMGVVMIVGISTEMAIFFVSEYRELARSLPRREALQAAARNRLRPIAMSSIAMMLALLPLGAAISGSGDQMLQPLAIAIMAGTLVQLPLVLLIVPALIDLAQRHAR